LEIADGKAPSKITPLRKEYAGIILSLAKQEYPDTSAYADEEIIYRVKKRTTPASSSAPHGSSASTNYSTTTAAASSKTSSPSPHHPSDRSRATDPQKHGLEEKTFAVRGDFGDSGSC
jgi:hypothetical protein